MRGCRVQSRCRDLANPSRDDFVSWCDRSIDDDPLHSAPPASGPDDANWMIVPAPFLLIRSDERPKCWYANLTISKIFAGREKSRQRDCATGSSTRPQPERCRDVQTMNPIFDPDAATARDTTSTGAIQAIRRQRLKSTRQSAVASRGSARNGIASEEYTFVPRVADGGSRRNEDLCYGIVVDRWKFKHLGQGLFQRLQK